MEKDLEIVIQLDEPREGFQTGVPYAVIAMEGRHFLLVNEEARFVWLPVEACRPHLVVKNNATLFERTWYDVRKRYEALLGKRVIVRSLEEMGVPGEQRDESGMFTFCGTLQDFERDLVSIVGEGDAPAMAKVTHQQIYSIEEA